MRAWLKGAGQRCATAEGLCTGQSGPPGWRGPAPAAGRNQSLALARGWPPAGHTLRVRVGRDARACDTGNLAERRFELLGIDVVAGVDHPVDPATVEEVAALVLAHDIAQRAPAVRIGVGRGHHAVPHAQLALVRAPARDGTEPQLRVWDGQPAALCQHIISRGDRACSAVPRTERPAALEPAVELEQLRAQHPHRPAHLRRSQDASSIEDPAQRQRHARLPLRRLHQPHHHSRKQAARRDALPPDEVQQLVPPRSGAPPPGAAPSAGRNVPIRDVPCMSCWAVRKQSSS